MLQELYLINTFFPPRLNVCLHNCHLCRKLHKAHDLWVKSLRSVSSEDHVRGHRSAAGRSASLLFGYFLWQLPLTPPRVVSYWLDIQRGPPTASAMSCDFNFLAFFQNTTPAVFIKQIGRMRLCSIIVTTWAGWGGSVRVAVYDIAEVNSKDVEIAFNHGRWNDACCCCRQRNLWLISQSLPFYSVYLIVTWCGKGLNLFNLL